MYDFRSLAGTTRVEMRRVAREVLGVPRAQKRRTPRRTSTTMGRTVTRTRIMRRIIRGGHWVPLTKRIPVLKCVENRSSFDPLKNLAAANAPPHPPMNPSFPANVAMTLPFRDISM
jgi:hypothetical protein